MCLKDKREPPREKTHQLGFFRKDGKKGKKEGCVLWLGGGSTMVVEHSNNNTVVSQQHLHTLTQLCTTLESCVLLQYQSDIARVKESVAQLPSGYCCCLPSTPPPPSPTTTPLKCPFTSTFLITTTFTPLPFYSYVHTPLLTFAYKLFVSTKFEEPTSPLQLTVAHLCGRFKFQLFKMPHSTAQLKLYLLIFLHALRILPPFTMKYHLFLIPLSLSLCLSFSLSLSPNISMSLSNSLYLPQSLSLILRQMVQSGVWDRSFIYFSG